MTDVLPGLRDSPLTVVEAYARVTARYRAEQEAYRRVRYGSWLEKEVVILERRVDSLMDLGTYQHKAHLAHLQREHLLMDALNAEREASGKPRLVIRGNRDLLGEMRYELVESKKTQVEKTT